MTSSEKVVTGILGVLLAGILSVIVGYWWSNTVPSRPRSVAPNAAFLWAPHVGLPAPRRGWWLACWEDRGSDRCRLSNIGGVTEFEGDYVPYNEKGPLPLERLQIAARKTERATKFWIGGALVPLVHLKDGSVLIPVVRLKQGRAALDGTTTH